MADHPPQTNEWTSTVHGTGELLVAVEALDNLGLRDFAITTTPVDGGPNRHHITARRVDLSAVRWANSYRMVEELFAGFTDTEVSAAAERGDPSAEMEMDRRERAAGLAQ